MGTPQYKYKKYTIEINGAVYGKILNIKVCNIIVFCSTKYNSNTKYKV